MKPSVVALFTVLLTACNGCAAWRGHTDPTRAAIIEAEDERAVEIDGVTPYGTYMCSGVLVSDHQVVTAAHCAMPGAVLTATRASGETAFFVVEVMIPNSDLVRLETVPGWFGHDPGRVVVGPVPSLGDRVCIAAVVPRRDHKCGEVQFTEGGAMYHSAVTEHGNSGSGLYDDAGRLVGIVSTLYMAQNGQIMGGGVNLIPPDYVWLVHP